jgi:outer membrane protein assembly factor BamB
LVLAYNKTSGKPAWQSDKLKGSWAPLTVKKVAGKEFLLAWANSGLNGFDPNTGKKLWSIPWKTAYDCHATVPAANGTCIFVTSGYKRGCQAFDLKSGSPKPLWEKTKAVASCNSDPVIKDGYVYSFSGNGPNGALKCLELKTGNVKWETKDFGNGSLVLVDGCFLVMGYKGKMGLVKADPGGFAKLAEMQVYTMKNKMPVYTAPAIAGNCVYVRYQQELKCFSLK